MPQLPHSIELHDSVLAAIRNDRGSIRLSFSPAYIHRDGKGWIQNVDVIVNAATLAGTSFALPSDVADGTLRTKLGPYHNLLNIPFATTGPVELRLMMRCGADLTIKGSGISHIFIGDPTFVEVFPDG